jgi:hypothetical protein
MAWRQFSSLVLGDRAIQVTAQAPYVYVSTAARSFMAFTYSESSEDTKEGDQCGKLSKIFGDEMGRPLGYHLLINLPVTPQGTETAATGDTFNKVVLLANADATLATIPHPSVPKTTPPMAHSTLVEMLLPQPINHIFTAEIRPPWLESSFSPPGIIPTPDILGASEDGSIQHFRLLDSHGRHLLRFLENLVIYDGQRINMQRRIQSFGNATRSLAVRYTLQEETEVQTIDPQPFLGTSKGAQYVTRSSTRSWAVDGDVLAQFAGADGEQVLGEMLGQPTWEAEAEGEEDPDVELRRQKAREVRNETRSRAGRFMELVHGVLGPEDAGDVEAWRELRCHDGDGDGDGVDSDEEMEMHEVSQSIEVFGISDSMAVHANVKPRDLKVGVWRCVVWLRLVLADLL